MKKIISIILISFSLIFINSSQVLAVCCININDCPSQEGMVASCLVSEAPECGTGKECRYTPDPEYDEYIHSNDVERAPFSSKINVFNAAIGLTSDSDSTTDLTSINGIISTFLPILMTIAGLILFVMLIMGGFSMMTATSDPQKADAGKQQITTALIGFFTLFASYWIIQILEIILGISILG